MPDTADYFLHDSMYMNFLLELVKIIYGDTYKSNVFLLVGGGEVKGKRLTRTGARNFLG